MRLVFCAAMWVRKWSGWVLCVFKHWLLTAAVSLTYNFLCRPFSMCSTLGSCVVLLCIIVGDALCLRCGMLSALHIAHTAQYLQRCIAHHCRPIKQSSLHASAPSSLHPQRCSSSIMVGFKPHLLLFMTNNKRFHFGAHVLGVCGPSPILPGWLGLSITVRTVDVQTLKIASAGSSQAVAAEDVILLAQVRLGSRQPQMQHTSLQTSRNRFHQSGSTVKHYI